MTELAAADAALTWACRSGDQASIVAAMAELDRLDVAAARARPAPSMLGSALWYAQAGLRVFPLSPGTKIPFAQSAGCLDASANPDVIRGWWESSPTANVGIATGYVVDVVDIDGLKGQVTRAKRADLFDIIEAHALGKVLTPRPGGMHIFVPAVATGNMAGTLEGIDYRGLGGYVVAPPSVIAEDWARATNNTPGRYAWLQPPRLGS